MDGWIRLHRRILESAVWHDPNAFRVFVWALMRASYAERCIVFAGQEMRLLPGQFVSGRFAGAKECGLNPSTFRDVVARLVSRRNLDIKSDNKKTVYTVVNWELYQEDSEADDSADDNKTTTRRQQDDTNKKERKKEESITFPTERLSFSNDPPASDRKPLSDFTGWVTKLVAAWNELPNPPFHRVEKVRGTVRADHLKTRYGDEVFRERCIEAIERISRSAFCAGKNARSWVASFDFLIKNGTNYVKILEGKYDDRSGNGKQESKGSRNYSPQQRDYEELNEKLADIGI